MPSGNTFAILGRRDASSAWVRRYDSATPANVSFTALRFAKEMGPDGEVVAIQGYERGRDADTGHSGDLPAATEAKVALRVRKGVLVSGHGIWRAECGGKLVRAYESAAYKAGGGPGPVWRYELLDTGDGTFGLFDGLSGDRVSSIIYEPPSEADVAKFGDAEYARLHEPARATWRSRYLR